jgi:hypothetical protein
MLVDVVVSFDGIGWLWMDNDRWQPELYMPQMGTVCEYQLCGC